MSFRPVDPPKVTRDPENQSVATAADTMFRVEATGDKLQFQWQKGGIDIDSSEPRLQSNSVGNASTLHIKETKKSDKGHYRCLIKNPVEKIETTSQEANLSVRKFVIWLPEEWVPSYFYFLVYLMSFHLVDPPKVTRDPENQSVATGADAAFRVEAKGDSLQFQWQKDGIDIDNSEPRLQSNSVGNASTLHIKDTKKSDKGRYRCLIKNPVEKMGTALQEANLSVCKFLIWLHKEWVPSYFQCRIT